MENKDVYLWLKTGGCVPDKSKVKLAVSLIEEELQELKEAVKKDSPADILDALEDLGWVCANVAYFYGLTLEDLKVTEENVSCSNWSKYCLNELEAVHTVEAYLNGTHPDKVGQKIDCYYEKVDEFWIVKRQDGKLMKSIRWVSPDKF